MLGYCSCERGCKITVILGDPHLFIHTYIPAEEMIDRDKQAIISGLHRVEGIDNIIKKALKELYPSSFLDLFDDPFMDFELLKI